MADEQKPNLRLEIAHVLFIDIVGYSKLLISEQTDLIEKLKLMVRGSEEVRAAEADGKLIRLATGDGMALVFRNSPEAPVQCAVELARADKNHPELLLRMGIHSGPINEVSDVNDRANVTGAGINMAQRIMDCGDAGHILLSQHVADDLEQYGQWRPLLHDLGECEVKHGVRLRVVNLYTDEVGNAAVPDRFCKAEPTAEPVATPSANSSGVRWARLVIAATLLALGTGVFFWRHLASSDAANLAKSVPTTATEQPASASSSIPEKSIAVLPFDNLSRDADNAYFAEGVQDEILTRLSKIADLKVISRTSTQHYKSAPENLPEIAKQLGVAQIVEGSVQKSGDAVRVNVQLIRARDDSHLWADTFDRKITDIFSVESDIANAIADQLGAKLTGREAAVIAAKLTDDPQAYDAYLRAVVYSQRAFTPDNLAASQRYAHEAVRLDPKFASAWALLAQIDSYGYISGNLASTLVLRDEARNAADTALSLQPNLGEALLGQGVYHYGCLKDYDAAVSYFERAREFLPNSSQIPEALAYVARRRGNWERSENYFSQAEQLSPRDVNLLTQRALSLTFLCRFADATRKLDQILEVTPGESDVIRQKALVAIAEGNLGRSAALLSSIPQSNDAFLVRVQTYQGILERKTAPLIPRIRQVLDAPNSETAHVGGPLPFSLGWAQEIAGDHAGAQASWRQARAELEKALKNQPEGYAVMQSLALTYAALGERELACQLADRAMAALPIQKEALRGGAVMEIRARVAVQTGDVDRALALLEQLSKIAYEGPFNVPLTPAVLRLDPLRNDPRFQKLALEPGAK